MKTLLPLILFLSTHLGLQASLIKVPSEVNTIQGAIDLAITGDVVEVSPGEYFENIDFKGKDILLTSLFHLDQDPSYIDNTIINGSTAAFLDTGSVVTFVTNEGPGAILQGFTITGGIGTIFYNSIENFYVRIGGGILIDQASPIIRFNKIIDNESTFASGAVIGAGGGGIRAALSRVVIENNTIANNRGQYAAGIMLADCYPTLRNNLIIDNTAGVAFNGGGGIYIDFALYPDSTIQIVNNTIVGNHSGSKGGGIIITGTEAELINNIIYGNSASQDTLQIFERGFNGTFMGEAIVSYSNVEHGWEGTGNFKTPPLFADSLYRLMSNSPCVDGGDPDVTYNDREDPSQPGNALAPALGTIRNDIGAFGGPRLNVLPPFVISANKDIVNTPQYQLQLPNPITVGGNLSLLLEEKEKCTIQLFDLTGRLITSWKTTNQVNYWEEQIPEVTSGMYLLNIKISDFQTSQKVFILP